MGSWVRAAVRCHRPRLLGQRGRRQVRWSRRRAPIPRSCHAGAPNTPGHASKRRRAIRVGARPRARAAGGAAHPYSTASPAAVSSAASSMRSSCSSRRPADTTSTCSPRAHHLGCFQGLSRTPQAPARRARRASTCSARPGCLPCTLRVMPNMALSGRPAPACATPGCGSRARRRAPAAAPPGWQTRAPRQC